MKTMGPEVEIVYSWTLSTLHPTADLRWDSDGMMDKDGEKIGLRKGGQITALDGAEASLHESEVSLQVLNSCLVEIEANLNAYEL